MPLRDLTEETIEYVHERYDPAAPASLKTRAVRVTHRKPAPAEWGGPRASESEADLKVRSPPLPLPRPPGHVAYYSTLTLIIFSLCG